MKNTKQANSQNTAGVGNKKRPEIRDDMDSREGEEQETKGDDITHNKKAHNSKKPGASKKA